MAEPETKPEGVPPAGATQAQPVMRILGQYVRDLSFENVVARKPIAGEVVNDIQVQVSLDARKRQADKQYEVVNKLNITSKNKGTQDVLFVLEMEYSGVFHIEGVPDEQMHPYLMIECPRMLFPYIRRIIGDVTRDGGFPPLNLDNIDYLALYRQELMRRAQTEKN